VEDQQVVPLNINQPPITEKKKFPRRVYLLVPVVIVAVLVVISAIFVLRPQSIPNPSVSFQSGEMVNVSPTPFPYQELTIPYLRQREYKSNLGELDPVSSNGFYTSYLTSYNSDGFKVNAQLTVPTNVGEAKNLPAIIFIHGYIPPANYQTLVNYASYVDYLARNGLVVFKIDLRGHGNSEGEAAGAYYSSDYIVDVLNAREALKGSDFVDPSKIGLWGHSMAGNVVARSVAASPDIPAAVIWAGAVYTYEDLQKYGIDDNSYRPPSEQSESRKKRNEMLTLYGQFDPDHEFWRKVPATNYLSDIKGAIQLNHAVNDEVVDIRFSRDFKALLDNAGVDNELNEYQSGGHNISGSSFNAAMDNTVSFFKENL